METTVTKPDTHKTQNLPSPLENLTPCTKIHCSMIIVGWTREKHSANVESAIVACCIVGVPVGTIVGHEIVDRCYHWECHSKWWHCGRCHGRLHHPRRHQYERRMVNKACSTYKKMRRTLSTNMEVIKLDDVQHHFWVVWWNAILCGPRRIKIWWEANINHNPPSMECVWGVQLQFPPQQKKPLQPDVLPCLANSSSHRHNTITVLSGHEYKKAIYPMT